MAKPTTEAQKAKMFHVVGRLKCPRCTHVHKNLQFKKLSHPSNEYTHYAACPDNGEPIMLKFEDKE